MAVRFLPGTQNFVTRMMYSNCQVPFYIYVETALPAALKAAMLLSIPQWDDLARDRASALARGPTKRGGPGHSKPRVRSRTPANGGMTKRYAQGLKALLVLTAPLEIIGFGLLLYGAVDGFFYDWMAYLDDADACQSSDFYQPFIRKSDGGAMLPNPEGGALFLPDVVANPRAWLTTQIGVEVPIGTYRVVVAAKIVGPGGGETEYSIGCLVSGAVNGGNLKGTPQKVTSGSEVSLVESFDLHFPFVTGGNIGWQISGPSVPVGLTIIEADVYIQRMDSLF